MKIKERFIDPFTDFGFKKLFGSELNKELLIDFLNELLKGRKQIINLRYSQNEHLGKTPGDRKAVLIFIVKMKTAENLSLNSRR